MTFLKRYFIIISFLLASCRTEKEPDPFEGKEFNPDRLQIFNDIPYGKHANQFIDFYLPANRSTSTKLIFYIHGGGWYGGDKKEVRFFGFNLLGEDYAIASINYRLTNTTENNHLEEQLEDIDNAIRFALRYAERLRFSDKNTIIMGSSAGGQLGLLYAYGSENKKKVKVAVALSTPTDLTDPNFMNAPLAPGVNGGDLITWLLKDTIPVNPGNWKKASPIFNLDTAVPTYFIHGSHDEFVPNYHSIKAMEGLRAKKIPSQLSIVENAGHNLFNHDLSEHIMKVDGFIRNNL